MSTAPANEPFYEVSIVVPIYNGENYIAAKLRSLEAINGVNYEVIIALNKSNDKSEELIDYHGRNIRNLRVIKHASYIPGGSNFLSGVKSARGIYVFVSAVDDICDKDFYSEAVKILNENQIVCAVSPMSRYDNSAHGETAIGFELLGDKEERVKSLFQNIRVSHGIFYSLIRRQVATAFYHDFAKDYSFIGSDWLFNLRLALEGQVVRVKNSECIFGVKGVSRQQNYLSMGRTKNFKTIFPYSNIVGEIIKLSKGQRIGMRLLLFKFSMELLRGNLHRFVFSFTYLRRLRKAVKPK